LLLLLLALAPRPVPVVDEVTAAIDDDAYGLTAGDAALANGLLVDGDK
jgi:hypothetical protein